MQRLEENRRTQRNRIIALVVALLPIFGGGGAYATNMISENARHRLEPELQIKQVKAQAFETRSEVDTTRKETVYNRLLILKVGRDISEQIAEAHGRPVMPLPTVEEELNKALAEMAGR